MGSRWAPPPLAEPTPEEIDGGYRLIPLSRGQVAKVDSGRYEWLMQWKWTAQWSVFTKSFYAVRQERTGRGKRRRVYMHRAIADPPSELLTDHIDHDTLNNRDYNLRPATSSQNACNRKVNPSDHRGISQRKNGDWEVKVRIGGRTLWIGNYHSIEMAEDNQRQAVAKLSQGVPLAAIRRCLKRGPRTNHG